MSSRCNRCCFSSQLFPFSTLSRRSISSNFNYYTNEKGYFSREVIFSKRSSSRFDYFRGKILGLFIIRRRDGGEATKQAKAFVAPLPGGCTSLVSNKSGGNVISCRLDPRLGPGRPALSLDSSFHVDAGLLVASVTHLALAGTWTIHACRFYTVPCYAFDYRQCAQHVGNVPRVHKRRG